jgi:hypothetical protein
MTARTVAVSVVTGLALAFPATVAAEARVVPFNFSGASCGAVATAVYRLPANARLAHATRPIVGQRVAGTKADAYSHEGLARVTGVDLQGRMLTITLAADPARCLATGLPGEPSDAPWTAALDANLSWITPTTRWARVQAGDSIGIWLGEAFEDEARTTCSASGVARFSCRFSTFAGDVSVVGRGTVSIGRDDEFPHYSFRAMWLNEYCASFERRPAKRCVSHRHWRQ